MKLTRRGILGTALAAPALITAPVRAAVTAPDLQNSGYFRFELGDFKITILSDGNLTTPTQIIGTNRPREEVTAYLQDRYLDPASNYAHTNHVLIDTGEAKILVDVGSGEKFQGTAGRLVVNMERAGIDPGDRVEIVQAIGGG